ncbi:hypothetical protein TUMSATVNIG3_45370 [Vibrio nigripulchritudo]|nr:hypothetical protein TUMSATVNIG2_44840 [Vibrio nigripulchritudo]BDU45739.1 hypothetical protein TUMSATVNIG3_45370 [Vibrio nigripulchritudo]
MIRSRLSSQNIAGFTVYLTRSSNYFNSSLTPYASNLIIDVRSVDLGAEHVRQDHKANVVV